MFIRIVTALLVGGSMGAMLGYFGKCSSGTCPLTATPIRGAMYGAVVALVLTCFLSASPGARSCPPLPYGSHINVSGNNREVSTMALEIESTADFNTKVSQSEGVVLVDFFSHSCPPCRALGPTVAKLAAKYDGQAGIYKVDVEKLMDAAQQWGIRKIPAVVILKDGREVQRMVGLRSEADYSAVLDKLIAQ